jgi:quercetin dioxygenase-like cupin family protein
MNHLPSNPTPTDLFGLRKHSRNPGYWILVGGVLLGTSLACGAPADSGAKAQAKRTIFDTHDQSGVDGKQIVLGTADLPAGAVVGWHIHYGDEAGYVLKGHLVIKAKGQPDRVLKAGDYFFNPAGLVHSLLAEPGTEGGTALSTWVVDKGKPLAEPVAAPVP